MPANHYRLTLVSAQEILPSLEIISAELTSRRFEVLSQYHLNAAFDPSVGDPLGDAWAITFSADLSNDASKRLGQHLSTSFTMDAVIQDELVASTPKKMAFFDMDSTLIQHEVMDELAYAFGIGEKISAITESAMRGELSFAESFEQRLACLKGFDASLIPEIAQGLKLTPGAEVLIKTLRSNGTKINILSGGFENFAVHLQQSLGQVDAIYANILEVENGKLTGKITNELVSETRKLNLIKALADDDGIAAEQTIAVGDGANDIPMLLHAGLGVAYRAKPLVQEKVQHCINHNGLAAILYVLGYSRSEFVE